ncbi:hypothetical protein BDR04DRAFT_1142713 [Suillus decipiens]|nr:hypothetical protein BDR04DRAFT_1142713 [Suillus decipiens]
MSVTAGEPHCVPIGRGCYQDSSDTLAVDRTADSEINRGDELKEYIVISANVLRGSDVLLLALRSNHVHQLLPLVPHFSGSSALPFSLVSSWSDSNSSLCMARRHVEKKELGLKVCFWANIDAYMYKLMTQVEVQAPHARCIFQWQDYHTTNTFIGCTMPYHVWMGEFILSSYALFILMNFGAFFAEIEDRSKGGLSNSIAMLQLAWFIVHYVQPSDNLQIDSPTIDLCAVGDYDGLKAYARA